MIKMEQENKPICKGFIAGILENKEIGNCSNNGISAFHKSVTIVSDIRECQIFETTPHDELIRPLVVIKKKVVCGEEHVYAEPIDDSEPGNVGWMMGGSFIWSSDSRFSEHFSKQPIPLHDRQESQEQYERLST